MPGIVRASVDVAIGTCKHPHASHPITCVVLTGSPLTDADGLCIGRINDYTINSCAYSKIGIIISASTLTDDQNLGIARAGDAVRFRYGVASFVQGSPNVDTD